MVPRLPQDGRARFRSRRRSAPRSSWAALFLLAASALFGTFLVGKLEARSASVTEAALADGDGRAIWPLTPAVSGSVLVSRTGSESPVRGAIDESARLLAPCLSPALAAIAPLLDELAAEVWRARPDDDVPTPHDELAPVLRAAPARAGPAVRAG